MEFGKAIDKRFYYRNEKELFEDKNRSKLWEVYEPTFSQLMKKLYYLYDVKDYYFINEFIDQSIHFPEKIHLLFELSNEDFEDLVDSFLLEDYPGAVQYYCRVGSDVYTLEENWEKHEGEVHQVFMRE